MPTRKTVRLPPALLSMLLLAGACGEDKAGRSDGGNVEADAHPSGDAFMEPGNPDAGADATAGADALAAVSCSVIRYAAADDARGDLCVPPAPRKVAMLLVHGGGSVQGNRREMQAWSGFLNASGHVTLNIDYTLVDETTPRPIFPLQERQVKAAVRYLRERKADLGVDRVVVLGTSAGARLGGIVFTTGDDAFFKEGSTVSDAVDGFVGFYGGYNGGLATGTTGLTLTDYYGGEPTSTDPAVRQRYAKANAIANAAQASGPALLIHGDADATVSPMQSIRFDQALRTAGKDSTLVIVPGAEHSFDREKAPGRPFTAAGRAAADQVVAWLQARFP